MSAPVIWLGIPAAASMVLWAIRSERWTAILGGSLALILSLLAIAIPIDQAVLIGNLSIRIAPVLEIFGRRLIISGSDQLILVLIYGIVAFWFFSAGVTRIAHRLVPLGFIITSLLLGSLAVEPFLYAALLIEMAVLIAVPLLIPLDQRPGKGVIRFLIFQTLAMPFILMAGFLLSGVEASPSDINLVIQAGVLLGLGFAFLLAVFPFYTWIPMICEEAPTYASGFVLMIFPTIGVLFGLSFLDRYTFLRESRQLYEILRFIGIITFLTAGLWALFQRHSARMMGYASIMATGLSILAMSLPNAATGVGLVFLLIIPRALGLGVWSLALTLLQGTTQSLLFKDIQGKARSLPFVSAAILAAALSMAGMVPLAGFPVQYSLWRGVGQVSLPMGFWFGIGALGLLVGAFRSAAVLVKALPGTPWQSLEGWAERLLLGLGITGLLLFGLFPQWSQGILANLTAAFERLGK
jgi:formate hydrogenlyase subunit 3/multisubunit Na+/H+ antiporter MnhD subunit